MLLLYTIHFNSIGWTHNNCSCPIEKELRMDTLFQVGTVISLLQGVYDGDVDFKTLALHGNTGLGTFNGVDGELIAIEGHFYRIDVTGVAQEVSPETLTPFALVSHFQPSIHLTLHDIKDLNLLCQLLDGYLPTPNIFYMIRIEVELDQILLRSVSCQEHPYKPFLETLDKTQRVFELQHTTGILVAVKSPTYCAHLNVPGYHFHYIDEHRKTGGHVYDLKLKSAKVSIQPLRNWNISFFNNELFDKANLELFK